MNNFVKNYSKHIIASVVFLAAYAPSLVWMWDRWWARDSYYSHGILIPFVSAYLIWQMRAELSKIQPKESPWGMRLIIIAFIILIISSVLRIYFICAVSMMIAFIGLILYFFGAQVLNKVQFPVAFLAFMIPLPMVVIANLSFKLKLMAAELARIVLNNMGIPAIREGSLIKMRHAHVVVDDVCSGLRSLISLAALGAIFAFWFKGPMVKRAGIFLATIPIAIVTNMCRVVILSSISEIWGTEYAGGFVHDATGMLVFVLAFVMLYAVGKLLE